MSTISPPSTADISASQQLPRFTIECQCIDVRISNPMYLNRLIETTCQLPTPPKAMYEACHSDINVKVIGFCSRLILDMNCQTTVITPSNASFSLKSIIKPDYWVNPDIPHVEMTFESGNYTVISKYLNCNK